MAKDDDVSIFDELDDRLDDFFAGDDDLFSEDDDFTAEATDSSPDVDIASEEDTLPATVNDEEIIEESEVNVADQPSNKKDAQAGFDSQNPLHQLKVIVLEMDWEISDENLGKYLAEIDNLIAHYKNDRPIYLFFKLHATIGKYMLQKKARAHPEALRFLYSVYNSLENALKEGVPLLEKNKLILDEVNNFRSLKKKLFPGFYPDESEDNIITESENRTDSSHFEENELENASFDISSLPDDIQNGINDYIEKMISKKIESINKKS